MAMQNYTHYCDNGNSANNNHNHKYTDKNIDGAKGVNTETFEKIHGYAKAYNAMLASLTAPKPTVTRKDIESLLKKDKSLKNITKNAAGHKIFNSRILDIFYFDYSLRDADNVPCGLDKKMIDDIQQYNNFLMYTVLGMKEADGYENLILKDLVKIIETQLEEALEYNELLEGLEGRIKQYHVDFEKNNKHKSKEIKTDKVDTLKKAPPKKNKNKSNKW